MMSSLIFYNGLVDGDAVFEELSPTTVIFFYSLKPTNYSTSKHYIAITALFFLSFFLNEPHNSSSLSAVSQQGQILQGKIMNLIKFLLL